MLELCRPPLGELHSVVHQLCRSLKFHHKEDSFTHKRERGEREREGGREIIATTDLVLEEEPSKGPDGTEHKEELIDLLAGVRWCVIWRQQCLQ